MLSQNELSVLSKNQTFSVRAMMDKERYLAEFEKGLCKTKYSDIGKEIVNGNTVVEEPVDDEDRRIEKEVAWQERRSELPYDFEAKDLDFGRQKATGMKLNKRVTPPNAKGCTHPNGILP